MNDLTQIGFDYAALPVDLAESLKIRASRYVSTRNHALWEMGKELYEAQQELAKHGYGCFGEWVRTECETSDDTAYNLISVYQNLDKLFTENFGKRSVLYLLAKPDTSQEVKDKALEKGKDTTLADVKDWKALESELESERHRREAVARTAMPWA